MLLSVIPAIRKTLSPSATLLNKIRLLHAYRNLMYICIFPLFADGYPKAQLCVVSMLKKDCKREKLCFIVEEGQLMTCFFDVMMTPWWLDVQ